MEKKLVILGAGGHAKVLIHTIKLIRSYSILAVIDPFTQSDKCEGYPIMKNEEAIKKQFSANDVQFVNGLGSTDSSSLKKRKDLFHKFKKLGCHFASIIHPQAIVPDYTKIGEGVQILAGSIIQPHCEIGSNAIINTGTIVEHECVIGSHTHLASGVTLSGSVSVGDSVHIGTGATVIQQKTIGDDCLLGAGAVVISHIPEHHNALGVPARFVLRDDIKK